MLSNVEFILLQILVQEGELSGYGIDKLIAERGYREWAGIGTTSIYVGLSKLNNKGLVKSSIYTKKQGKGPLPKKYLIVKRGIKVLKKQVWQALSSVEQRTERFDLALAALPILEQQEIVQALTLRYEKVKALLKRIKTEKFEPMGGYKLPQHVVWLFEHSFLLIKHEIKFTKKMLNKIQPIFKEA